MAASLWLGTGVAVSQGHCAPHTVPAPEGASVKIAAVSKVTPHPGDGNQSARTPGAKRTSASTSEPLFASKAAEKTSNEIRFAQLAQSKPEALTEADGEFIVTYCQTHSHSSAAHALLGLYLQKAGYYSLACDEAALSWRLNRNEPGLAYSAIKVLVDNSMEPEAGELAMEAMKHYRHNYQNLLNLIVVLQVEKQHEVALKVLQAAQQLRPDQPELLLMHIHSLVALDRFDEAEAPATRLTQWQATRSSGLLALGQIWQHRKNNEKAATYLRQAYALSKTDASICKTLFQVLTESGLHCEAREPGLMAVVKFTGAPEAKQMKKTIIANMRKYDLRRFESTAETIAYRLAEPKELSYLFYSVADIADNLGGVRHAIGYYQLGLKTNPNYGRAYMRLARDLEKVGMEPDRVSYLYTQAMHLAPQDKEVLASLSRNEMRSQGTRDFASRLKSQMHEVFPPASSIVARSGTETLVLTENTGAYVIE